MDMRELKALELAARTQLVWEDGGWTVPSQSGAGKYRVVLWPGEGSCTCEDWQLRQQPCKHIIAARLVQEREGKGAAPPIDTSTLPEKKKYPRNWTNYNEAQITEKHRLQVLLADLCAGVQEPTPPRVGRRPIPLADRLFACAFKVYSTLSSRRFGSDLSDAHERGHMSRGLHPNKVNCFLECPDLTAPLRDLIRRSALPLRTVETEFAVDSSGFSVSKFVRWFDERYGAQRSGHDWTKVHVCTGIKTNVVTAVEILDRDAADCPQFKPLVAATAEGFTVREVSADKAYLSVDNLELVAGLGGTAFVPFKVNSVAGEAGSLWERMFFYYQFRREEFLKHYHRRSLVESTFSMVKRKFGDAIRSRTETAMVNETLCKFLCHNLCVLILSQIELGIEPVFWGEQKADESRDVLPLIRRR
jgi:transposase